MRMDTLFLWSSILLQNFAETFLLICVFRSLLGGPKKNAFAKYFIIAAMAFGYCLFLNLVSIPVSVKYVLSFSTFFIYSLFFEGTIWKKIFAVLCDFFITAFCSVSTYWLISLAVEENTQLLSIDSLLFALPNVIVLTSVGFGLLIGSKNKNTENKLTRVQWVLMMLYPAVAFLLMMSLYVFSVSKDDRHGLLFIDGMALMIAMVVHFVLLYLFNEQNQALEHSRLVRQEILLSKEKAEALREAYDEQRGITHDFENQLNAIRGLLEQKKGQQAKHLIDELLPALYSEPHMVNTQNPLIDTILNQKYARAKRKGIVVFFILNNLRELPIPDPDILTVIGNLFDNAIEGSDKVTDPEIQIKIQLSEDDFVLSFRNRVTGTIEFDDADIPASTKKEKGHGYGLKNTIAIFEKNGMDYSISCRNGWFQVSAIIYRE